MNFKKNWKRFWTLSSAREGFTLVELIVVIAILAILAGVAVPAYSGYVKKANMQADMTLAGEIKQALILAHYSGKLTPGDYVVINYGGAAEASSDTADAAMVAVFGDSWADTCVLSYGEWELGVVADGEMMNYVSNSPAFKPENLDSLLTSVQYITDQFSGYLDSGVSINPESDLGKYLSNAGIDYTNDSRAASNGTVMYVANVLSQADVSAEDYYTAWVYGNYDAISSDPMVSSAAQYATTLAVAQHIDSLYGTSYSDTLSSATGRDVLTVMQSVYSEIGTSYSDDISKYFGLDANGNITDFTSQGFVDAQAFMAYMSGVDSSSDSLMANTNLSSDTYFTDGTVLNYVTTYVSAGSILSDLGADNSFVIYYDGNGVACVPLDY